MSLALRSTALGGSIASAAGPSARSRRSVLATCRFVMSPYCRKDSITRVKCAISSGCWGSSSSSSARAGALVAALAAAGGGGGRRRGSSAASRARGAASWSSWMRFAAARSIIESSLISSVDVLGSVRSQFELTA